MANFELRIYVIGYENFDQICEDYGIHDITDLTDEQVVEVAEELGTVYSFNKFLGLDVIAFDKDHVRAYFIDKDNENTPPIPADRHNTVITASKITCDRIFADTVKNVALFEEEKEEDNTGSKTYTIVVSNYDEETSTDGIVEIISNLDDVLNVEVVDEDEHHVRLKVETETYFDYDTLEGTIDSYGGLDCEFIDRVDNY